MKDGKISVLLKGLGGDKDAKKYYDFDQVIFRSDCIFSLDNYVSFFVCI
jgi:hypothetical protein